MSKSAKYKIILISHPNNTPDTLWEASVTIVNESKHRGLAATGETPDAALINLANAWKDAIFFPRDAMAQEILSCRPSWLGVSDK